jgi:flagellar protein FliS
MTGYQKYRGVQVEGASPLELILLTYNVLIKSLQLARLAGENNNFSAEADQLARALEALIELSTSLDMEKGGTIAENLGNLYAYMSRRLLEGSTSDIGAAIDEVLSLANSLREGWQEISDSNSGVSQLKQAVG